MSVIISSNNDDYSTNNLLDWFWYYDIDFIRINEGDSVEFVSLNFDKEVNFNMSILVNGNEIKIDKQSIYWYRRGFINFNPTNQLSITKEIKEVISEYPEIRKYISDEIEELTIILNSMISEKQNPKAIGCYSNNFTVKMNNLKTALQVGLKIPKTKLLTRKSDLISFFRESKKGIITKAIRHGLGVYSEEVVYEGYTKKVDAHLIECFPNKFFPTLFQEDVEKFIEIRTFFICGKFFSMAIFSQNDSKTKVDFRNYNRENPNRTPPFQLPQDIEDKLLNFFDEVNMKSGSVDLLLTKEMEYIFLEVNPIGQYSQVSIPCNYYLDNIICNQFIQIKNEQNK